MVATPATPAATAGGTAQDCTQAFAAAAGPNLANGGVLTTTVKAADVEHAVALVITVKNVRTPSSPTGTALANGAIVVTDGSAGIVADGAGVTFDAIAKGTVAGGTFTSTVTNPGQKSDHTLTFTTVGQIIIDGTVALTLPNANALTTNTVVRTYDMAATPGTPAATAGGTAQTCVQAFAAGGNTATGGVLTTTIKTTDVEHAVALAITVKNVRTPSSPTGAALTNGAIVVTDGSAGIVADGAGVTFSAIT